MPKAGVHLVPTSSTEVITPLPKLRCETIVSIKSYTEIIESLLASPSAPTPPRGVLSPLWYRGVSQEEFELKPKLFRHKTVSEIAELLRIETELLIRFRQRSIPYLSNPVDDDFDCLFLMQHFGVPTRLLDWTENPFIALWFALSDAGVRETIDHDAAVWILNPVAWNRSILSHNRFNGGILSPVDTVVKNIAPRSPTDDMIAEPLAIYGAHNSQRIIAQKGAFTIFSKGIDPIESVYDKKDFPADSLLKLIIPKDVVMELYSSLMALGITDSVVYPDLTGLAKELRFAFGFGG